MKVLVYGANGWIGGYFARFCSEKNIEAIPGESRCDDFNAVDAEINKIRPDRVVLLIGRTSGNVNSKNTSESTIDFLELPGNLRYNIRDNLYSPVVMVQICKKYNIHLTYLGTGCIFSYFDNDPFDEVFTEDSQPNFFGSQYSIVKGFTDQFMHNQENVLNVRIRMPVTHKYEPKNILYKILNYQKIHNSVNSMTVLEDLIPVLIEKIIRGDSGTYHMINSGAISHNEILQEYAEIVDPEFKWENATNSEIESMLVAKRSRCVLKADESSPDIKNSIRKIFKEWAENLKIDNR